MIRFVAAGLAPALLIAVAIAWALATPGRLPARFAPADCRQVGLIDTATGREIVGAEDIVLGPDGDTLILSARDRRDRARPDGGLYAVGLSELGAGSRDVSARPLVAGHDGPFRPHGIALSPDGGRLAVVNHVSRTAGAIEVGPLDARGWRPAHRLTDPRLCRANDVAFSTTDDGTEALRVTIDRADCTVSVRDLAGGTGSLAAVRDGGLEILRSGLDFPNGLAAGWVAETRGGRLSRPGRAIVLPGGPDNLGVSGDRLVAALLPNLMRTWLDLDGGLVRSGSRIVAVDPATGAVETLYDDPRGEQYSGATVGVLAGNRLVAGSATARGVLYCGEAR